MADEPAAGAGASGPMKRKMSGLAIASLLCSTAIFCPPLTVIGPLLGVRVLVLIRRDRARRGRALAVSAIVIGVLLTAGWSYGLFWWDHHARQPMLTGPQAALQAGFRGDADAFRSQFHGRGATAGDAEIAALVGELGRRYGAFIDASIESDGQVDGSAFDRSGVGLPYILRFESATVRSTAVFNVWVQDQPGLVLKFASFVVVDPDRGDLIYPQLAPAPGEPE